MFCYKINYSVFYEGERTNHFVWYTNLDDAAKELYCAFGGDEFAFQLQGVERRWRVDSMITILPNYQVVPKEPDWDVHDDGQDESSRWDDWVYGIS